jgi:hypothetical protein
MSASNSLYDAYAAFWGRFCTAFPSGYAGFIDEHARPTESPVFPYITYDVAKPGGGASAAVRACVWTRTPAVVGSFAQADEILSRIEAAIPEHTGALLRVQDSQTLWLTRGDTFITYEAEPADPYVARAVVNCTVRFCSPESGENMQLIAGTLFANVTLSEIKVDNDGYADLSYDDFSELLEDARRDGRCLGLTVGGSFRATPVTEHIRSEGRVLPLAGTRITSHIKAVLTTHLTEASPKAVKRYIQSLDTCTNMCWVGYLTGGELVCIALKNPVNTQGFAYQAHEKSAATMPVSFEAYYDYMYAMAETPYSIFFVRREAV